MSGELTVVNSQVPAEIGELVNFVKLGREQLKIARDGLKMVDKMNLENEKRTAALRQVQELSVQLIDAEMKLGAIMATLPTAPGTRTDLDEPEDSAVPRTKQAILKLAGFSVKTAQRFEMLAAHPEIIEKMKVEAYVNGTVLSRTAVLRAINEEENLPFDKHFLQFTGQYHVDALKVLSGHTPMQFNGTFDEEEALAAPWHGSVFLFLPYQDLDIYVQKLAECFDDITDAFVVVPVNPTQRSFRNLLSIANAIMFIDVELGFEDIRAREKHNGTKIVDTKEPYVFVYIGSHKEKFFRFTRDYGWGMGINNIITTNQNDERLPDDRKLPVVNRK